VLLRDGEVCWLCGLPGARTVDHVIARHHGGSDSLDNLRAAHRDCNGRKGARAVIPPARIARPS
jgi:5-methylcytosine-specific restriction endonuclease McrA